MNVNKLIKLEIVTSNTVDGRAIRATYASGDVREWSQADTVSGAKRVITRDSKRFGLTKSKCGTFATA